MSALQESWQIVKDSIGMGAPPTNTQGQQMGEKPQKTPGEKIEDENRKHRETAHNPAVMEWLDDMLPELKQVSSKLGDKIHAAGTARHDPQFKTINKEVHKAREEVDNLIARIQSYTDDTPGDGSPHMPAPSDKNGEAGPSDPLLDFLGQD